MQKYDLAKFLKFIFVLEQACMQVNIKPTIGTIYKIEYQKNCQAVKGTYLKGKEFISLCSNSFIATPT